MRLLRFETKTKKNGKQFGDSDDPPKNEQSSSISHAKRHFLFFFQWFWRREFVLIISLRYPSRIRPRFGVMFLFRAQTYLDTHRSCLGPESLEDPSLWNVINYLKDTSLLLFIVSTSAATPIDYHEIFAFGNRFTTNKMSMSRWFLSSINSRFVTASFVIVCDVLFLYNSF